MKSESIAKLATALALAQSEIKNALKDKNNPFFKSTYADLASVWDAAREPLTKNGLSVSQPILIQNEKPVLCTLLMHTSGEWLQSISPINPVKNDPQSLGSAITYMRRFSLAAIVGIVPSEDMEDADDDGNKASHREFYDSTSSYGSEKVWSLTEAHKQTLIKLMHDFGWTKEDVSHYLKEHLKKNGVGELSEKEFSQLCNAIRAMKKK